MSVHKAITKHVNEMNDRIRRFALLEEQRELLIEEAIMLYKEGKPFTTDKINSVTSQMNELAKLGGVPSRKLVTTAMVKEFVDQQ
ncbi:YpbS family protein [Cytobacillus spongiae]|jgi:hypothetical protein|uniref:DUF2533 family protein n=1 Tax=Cytobacillus spongiae TaxID=2901381 RepID=UPI001F19D992|nr:DUF2533 family protein [Cytobacillus spongiae]UII54233.1 YpbS family protein [Cytobacillus spongiae]